MKKFAIAFMFLFTLVSCAGQQNTVERPRTAFFPNTTRDKVADAIVAVVVADGMTPMSDTRYSVTLSKTVDNFGAMFLYGSKHNRVPERRDTYVFTSVNGGIQVTFSSCMVTNPGSGMESSTDITGMGLKYFGGVIEKVRDGAE